MNDRNASRATRCAPGQPAGLHLALQRYDGFKDQSPKACAMKPGRELPTPKAQTIFVVGVMGYQRHPAAPGATFAMLSFDKLLALAKARGFKGAKQIKGAVRRGRATAFAMDQARDLATLVTNAELQREIASLSFWDSLAQPHNHQRTTP